MKRILSALLVLTMALSLAACGANKTEEPAETTAPAANLPGSALEILETVWADFAEDEKFAVIGGSMAAPVDGAPGSYDIADENITYSLLIPADQLANVTEAASMIHMMNANTFTVGAFKLAEGVDAAAFVETMRQAVQGNMWMCGFPEKLNIVSFGDAYVLVAFGVGDIMTPFATHLTAVYPDAQLVIDEEIL